MSRRKKKKRAQGDVELNLAAMLDMAFQLLTFFILTFKPAPVEGQISLRMPPPMPVVNQAGAKEPGKDDSPDPLQGLNRIVVSVITAPQGPQLGQIVQLRIGENNLAPQKSQEAHLANLNKKLTEAFTGTKFDEIVLQASSGLQFDSLMQVVDVCTRQKLANGERLSKLTFVELPDGTAKPAPKKTK